MTSVAKVMAPWMLLALGAAARGAADQPLIGQSAPGFNLVSLSGARVDLDDFRGKIVVLHFGTGW